MEVRPGVFASSVSTDAWAPDPDVPGTDMHELVHQDGAWAGMTRISSVEGPIDWTPEQRETAIVLEGSVRIEFEDGSSIELGVGDIVSIGAGVAMRWHVTTPFKELWFFAD